MREGAILFCLALILFLAPTVTVFAYAAFAPLPGSTLGSPHRTNSPAPTAEPPLAVSPNVPPGFTPSHNPKEFDPVFSNTAKAAVSFSSNDGYCYFGSGICGQLTYHGGAVMHNASIVLVLWAGCGSKGCLSCSTGYFDNSTIDPKASNPNDCTYGNLQLDYFRDFCAAGNPVLRIMDQYTDSRGGLGSCSVYGGKWYYDYTRFPETLLSDGDIQAEAIGILKGMNISANTNTAVFMFTPYGVSSCAAQNDCFPTGTFCAYHSWFWSGTPYLSDQVVYASLPDSGWAGANCGLGGPSPNHDPFADLEVSPLSHESDEMFTDPTPGDITGDGWYHGGFFEIGDECAYDFAGTQPADGSNVHLGLVGTAGDPYRIQTEWSNANGGCTLDIHGPPTLFQEVIFSDVSTGATASPQEFPIRFQEAGETGVYASIRSNCCSVNTTFYATPNSYVTTYPVVNSSEHWCFDASCTIQTTYVVGQVFLPIYYFDLLHQSASYQVNGGGSVPAPKLTYKTAPLIAAQGDNTRSETLTLSNSSLEFWALRGSDIIVPPLLAGGATERWAAQQSYWTVTAADLVPSTIVYYHQYITTLSYSVVDGGTPAAPVLSFSQLGSTQEGYISNTPSTYWLDSGTPYHVTNPLSGSLSTERWIAKSSSATANGSAAAVFIYYHQYYLNASYSVVDGGTPPAPSVQIEVLGDSSSLPLTLKPTSSWVDANSWSVPDTLTTIATERWAAVGGTNGTVSSSLSIAPAYYHQFRFIVSYVVSDNSAVTAPTFTSRSFGKDFVSVLGGSAVSYWFDNGAPWGFNHLLNGSGSLEMWVTNSPTGGTVSAPLTASFEYFHEFYVTIQAVPTSGGTVPLTTWYNATTALKLSAQPSDGWQFERWDGSGKGGYSGTSNDQAITILSPITENATFYPGLVLTSTGSGQVAYHWGTSQGAISSGGTLYVPIGTNVTLAASPASSFFTFNGYSGAVNTGRTASSVVVDGPITVRASFGLSYTLLGALFGSIALGGAGLVYYLNRPKKPKQ